MLSSSFVVAVVWLFTIGYLLRTELAQVRGVRPVVMIMMMREGSLQVGECGCAFWARFE